MLKLKCPNCGSILHLEIGYTGCEWDTVAGEGSGYGYPLSLCCNKQGCGCVFTLGNLRNSCDFSEVIEKMRPYEGRLND